MKLKLNVYTDETLTEIERTIESDRLKIPYGVVLYVAESVDRYDLKATDDLFYFAINSLNEITKIVKATFGITDNALDYIDVMELTEVGVEIYKFHPIATHFSC